MRKRLTLLSLVAVVAVGGTVPAATAQTSRVAQTDTATNDDDGGTDYGWIGLLGLAGLAGLLGRRRADRGRTTDRDVQTTRRP